MITALGLESSHRVGDLDGIDGINEHMCLLIKFRCSLEIYACSACNWLVRASPLYIAYTGSPFSNLLISRTGGYFRRNLLWYSMEEAGIFGGSTVNKVPCRIPERKKEKKIPLRFVATAFLLIIAAKSSHFPCLCL